MKINLKKDQKGAAAVIAILGICSAALAISTSLTVLALGEMKMVRNGGAFEQAYLSAESGLNEALYRLIENPVPGAYDFEFAGSTVEISVLPNPADPFQRIVLAKATENISGKTRTVRITANTDSFAAGFDYAVQGGTGGVYLSNGSTIQGDIYSNGSILPATPGQRGSVNGNAWVADANTASQVDVTGSIFANNIHKSTAAKLYYTSVDPASRAGGSSCPNSNCYSGHPNPEPKSFPIDDAVIQVWKDEIDAIANPVLTENPSDCPPSKSSGFYCVTSGDTLGSVKIEGDMYVGNGANLVLSGNIWVTGSIILDNNGSISLDPSLGPGSAVIIADGKADVNNNYTINGSGNPASFLLLISLDHSVDPSSPAVYAANNSASIVFAALNGMLKVKNNGSLNAASAKSIHLEQNSTVTFNPLLSMFTIPTGSGENIGAALGTWEEL